MKFAEQGGISVLLGGLCPTFCFFFPSLTILQGQSLRGPQALDLLHQAELLRRSLPDGPGIKDVDCIQILIYSTCY